MTKRINLARVAEKIQEMERMAYYLTPYRQKRLNLLRRKFVVLSLRRRKFDEERAA